MVNTPWPRRLVVCCDGTWQSSVTSHDNVPSNVTKLCRHVARLGDDSTDPGKKWHQLVYYDSGIGTGSISGWEKTRQGGLGDGLAENVIEAYNFIVLNYQEGDEIFCFGFSRGAYTARAVAGLVTDIGVIKPGDMQLFPEIYRAYKRNKDGKPFKDTDSWKAFEAEWKNIKKQRASRPKANGWKPEDEELAPESSRKVKVVGVWDTVGSLGIPDGRVLNNAEKRAKYGFHNVKLNGNIEHAYHALALDEHRKAFRPTLWYIPKEMIQAGGPLPELKQVWFPGYHINVGGGSDDGIEEMKGDLEGLANITFAWMLQCISPYLTIDLKVFENHKQDYTLWLKTAATNCTRHHETWLDWAWKKVPFVSPNELDPPRQDPPHTHDTVDFGWGTGPTPDSLEGFIYEWAGGEDRKPGNCDIDVWHPSEGEYKLEPASNYGVTNEYIHPVTAYRQFDINNRDKKDPKKAIPFEKKNKNIEGRAFEARELVKGGKKFSRYWWKKGDVYLPEWVILSHRKNEVDFERMWLEGGDGMAGDEKKWLDTVDADLKPVFDEIRNGTAYSYP
ncbi:hypothetical protein K469DRAFT_725126 [Zopfia rhizophila CBS 207.26]|uniref:T6SS Phospholipase effector Tle1-like catalytic domain-containing protein n=1 Tax=Zopfia rhizophila CBS 207.26 TaxID=1314779 RepID=A0A6A6EAQ2_9PEZI|nr:hypothetical protein K469DRAFT_725126 [Zopfia rhizophila CBS 207.26]